MGSHTHDDRYLQFSDTKADGILYSGTTDPSNTTRLNYDGYFYATKVYNSIYNDYADSFKLEDNYNINDMYYKIMAVNDNDKAVPADENSEVVLGIASNMYGFIVGSSEEKINNNEMIPISVAGYVLVKIYDTYQDQCKKGKFIVPFKDGFGKPIEKKESFNYIGKIVGEIIKVYDDGTCKVKVINL